MTRHVWRGARVSDIGQVVTTCANCGVRRVASGRWATYTWVTATCEQQSQDEPACPPAGSTVTLFEVEREGTR